MVILFTYVIGLVHLLAYGGSKKWRIFRYWCPSQRRSSALAIDKQYKECTRSTVSKDGHMAKVSNKRPTLNSSHPHNMNAVFSTPCHGPLSTCTSPASTMVSPLVSGAHLQEGRVAELLHRLLERGILRNLGRAPHMNEAEWDMELTKCGWYNMIKMT